MKVWVLGFVLFLGLGLPGCATESPAEMVAAAKNLDQKFLSSFNKQDLNNVMALYWNSPDLVVFSPDGQEWRGWNAAKDMYDSDLPKMKGCTLELTESHYQVAGETVISWGLWRMKMPKMSGAPEELHGGYTEVAAKRGGAWVYVIDHPSLKLPPQAPAPAKKRAGEVGE